MPHPFALATVAAVGASLVAAVAPASQSGTTRMVDRTVVCAPMLSYLAPNEREFSLFAEPQQSYPASLGLPARTSPSLAFVESGAFGPSSRLVSVLTRRHPGWRPGAGPAGAGVLIHRTRCRPTTTRVALTPRGLPGPPTLWAKEHECRLRGRIVVRVRAELQAPAQFRIINRSYVGVGTVGVGTNVVRATIAVKAAATGKMLGLARIDETTSSTWISGACG